MQRAAEIAAIGSACRQTLEDKHQAREVVLVGVAPRDSVVGRVDPRDASGRVRSRD